MKIWEAIEALKNNNKLCCDDCEGECGSYKDGKCYCAEAIVVSALEEYSEIGTVEECREAKERRMAKKPVKDRYHHDCCPNCGWIVYQDEWGGRYLPYCENCGQAIDWMNTK